MTSRAAAPHAAWRPWIRRCVTTLVVLMVAYLAVAWWSVRGDIVAALREFPLATLPSVICLVLAGLLLRIVRWHFYVRRLGWRFPLGDSVLAFLASLALTATPGKAGEAIKVVLLQERHEIGISAGVGALIVERLGDVIAVLILSVTSFALVKGVTNYLLLVAIVVATATLFVGSSKVHGLLLVQMTRFRRLGGMTHRVACSLDACRQLLRPLPFLIGAGIAVIAWSCEAAAFFHLARSAGIDIGWLQASSIYGAATLAGVVSALPGGVGGFEAAMVFMLNRIGVGVAAAMPLVVVFRLCTLWFGILVGATSMLIWMTLRPARAPVHQADIARGLQ